MAQVGARGSAWPACSSAWAARRLPPRRLRCCIAPAASDAGCRARPPPAPQNPSINVYDIRKQCEGPLCYSQFGLLDDFINLPEIRQALGVGDRGWTSCDPGVYVDMMGDWMKTYDRHMPEMLADGVRIMVGARARGARVRALGWTQPAARSLQQRTRAALDRLVLAIMLDASPSQR
jgi:hypothetical protein